LVSFSPIKTPIVSGAFELTDLIDRLVGSTLRSGDVLVISSKFIAISEGRVVALDSVKPSHGAVIMSERFAISPEMSELILRESDEILGGVQGFVLALKDGLITPNAGIDKSNIEHGKVVLYPRNPLESAVGVRERMRFSRGVEIGVVVCDSRLMPSRKGTVGVALAASGIEGILDLRGKVDLFGNTLKVTSQAIADALCSGAQLIMGESDESRPIVLVKGLPRELLKNVDYGTRGFSIPTDQCVYTRSLGYKTKQKILRAS
jgi:coenzyme F420-0:L-glutamate ligase